MQGTLYAILMTRPTKILLLTFSLTLILTSSSIILTTSNLIIIPTQNLNLYELLGDTTRPDFSKEVKEFEISSFVTYKEYKEYLQSIKSDSSENFYQTQLPDKNIAPPEIRNIYLTSNEYDNYPVLGISWDNAMNFCKWKSLKDNSKEINFIYRLPYASEWLSAYSFLTSNKINNDLNKKYSDWLLNSKDESHYDFTGESKKRFLYDYIILHRKEDPQALKRKFVIGKSYLFQLEELKDYYSFSYYATEGYRQISFRLIKVPAEENVFLLKYWGIINE